MSPAILPKGPPPSLQALKEIARVREGEFRALVERRLFSGAVLSAALSAEAILKAKICRHLDVPTLSDFMFIHDLRRLWTAAGLDGEVRRKSPFGIRLYTLRGYVEDAQEGDIRYRHPGGMGDEDARRMADWVFHPEHGVVPCVRRMIP